MEVLRPDSPPPPETKAALDNLLARWLVRAYLRKHAGAEPDRKCREAVEVKEPV